MGIFDKIYERRRQNKQDKRDAKDDRREDREDRRDQRFDWKSDKRDRKFDTKDKRTEERTVRTGIRAETKQYVWGEGGAAYAAGEAGKGIGQLGAGLAEVGDLVGDVRDGYASGGILGALDALGPEDAEPTGPASLLQNPVVVGGAVAVAAAVVGYIALRPAPGKRS